MRSSNSPVQPQVDPLAPVQHVFHWLLGTASHVVLGLAIGMIAARLMRSRQLHWSWPAAGLALVLLARPAFAGSVSVLGVAALAATVWSRRWHREDIEAGGDLAQIAAGRRGPLDVVRSVLLRATSPRRQILRAGGGLRGGELILGHDENNRI